MNDIWQGLRPVFDTLGVEPWMYPLLLAFGVAHQFACGYLRAWTRGYSFVSALALATIFGALSCNEHGLTPLTCGTRVVVLLASALLAELAAARLAGIIPGIPKYNEKVPVIKEDGQ